MIASGLAFFLTCIGKILVIEVPKIGNRHGARVNIFFKEISSRHHCTIFTKQQTNLQGWRLWL